MNNYNSTIKSKKCKCGCNRYPSIGYSGYAYSCAPKEILDRVGSKKDVQKRNKAIIAKNSRELYKHTSEQLSAENKAEITPQRQWFLDRRKEMTGFCQCGCGRWSSKKDDKYFHCSIAHILAKGRVKSMALHPLNFVEMNFWDGCHSNMDNRSSDNWEGMACWDEIVFKFKAMYPLIPDYEKRWIPQVLLNQL